MKKLVLIVLMVFATIGLQAQKKLFKSAQKEFKKASYDAAISMAQEALGHPETEGSAAVPALIGKAYLQKFILDKTDVASAQKSLKFLAKATQMDGPNGKITKDLVKEVILLPSGDENSEPVFAPTSGDGLLLLKHYAIDEGNKRMDSDNYKEAGQLFEIASIVEPSLEMAFFTGYAYYTGEEFDKAEKFYGKVLNSEEDYENKKYALDQLIDLYFRRREDYEKALEFVKIGMEKYPEERNYQSYQVDILIKTDRLDEAIKELEGQVASGSGTKTSHYILGYLYWNAKEYDKAIASAENALKEDAEYFDALYVAGAVHYDVAVNMNNEANNSDDDTKYEELKSKAKESFKKARPYFERAVSIKGEDTAVLNPLSAIYDQLGMAAERDAILDKIEALEGGE